MPPAPCTTGSTITAASSSACARGELAHLRRPALVERRVEAVRRAARRRRARRARRRTGCASRRPGRRPPSRRPCRRGSRRARSAAACAPARPRARWYCSAILIATSTATEPESAKNTRSRPAGASSREPLGQPDRRLVREAAEHHVRHPPELLAHGRVERRVAVAVDRAPPRGHPVDQLAPVGQPQAHPLGRDDRQRGQRRGQRAVGMPDALGVEREQLVPVRVPARASAGARAARSRRRAVRAPPDVSARRPSPRRG